MATIEVEGLTKRYGDLAANDDVTFDVDRGEIFGYLGPNGAGKTTTIRLLLGLINPTAGTASVLGADIRDRQALTEAKADVGYLPDTLGFDERQTGRQVLDQFARMRGDRRREELLDLVSPPLEKRVETYSSGNRRMLGIVQAFMHDPTLVIMDEPTAGLDPLKRDRLHKFLEAERDAGKTLFLSSHVLGEVQRVCDRVGIIRDGKLVALEDIEALIERSGKRVRVSLGESADETEFRTDGMADFEHTDGSIQFTYNGDIESLLAHLGQFPIEDLEITRPQLDEVFKRYYRDNGGVAQS